MAVPVLQDEVFVAARLGSRQFSQQERQVITNFAFQFGIAADNSRLLDAQQEALQVKDQFFNCVPRTAHPTYHHQGLRSNVAAQVGR